jgi:phosphomannomutase
MTLIKSISGIRGTIGGKTGENLTPIDVLKFTTAFGIWIKQQSKKEKYKVVVGRDARISGEMVNLLVSGSLMGVGIDVIDIGLATTPTTEIAVTSENADGGIILTASHNPRQWNALKLLNNKGEFLSAKAGNTILELAETFEKTYIFDNIDNIGKKIYLSDYTKIHVDLIKNLELVDIPAIKKANFTVAIDCVNSVGGIAIPLLLKELGVSNIIELYCNPNGEFPHNPEPLPEHLTEISKTVVAKKADVGFVVDPDVDRLAIINEDGTMFGEEYTLVAVADYILQNKKGSTVSNLSSSFALKDITLGYGQEYFSSAVGELNVVEKMKEVNAVIGGEGNGGVIYPELHYGRDSLVGIALFLSYLAKSKLKCSDLRKKFPEYYISKNKIELSPDLDVDKILLEIINIYKSKSLSISTVDGVKIDFEKEWIHLRKSNTEPIIRIYSESASKEKAEKLAETIISEIKNSLK